MHLRTLEAAVGQSLVIRNGRGSRLTAAGTIVAAHAAQVLATLERMRWALDAMSAPSSGELTLAACPTASLALIPPVLREFSERHPGVSVNVRTLPSEMVAREVARGAADIGIAGEVAGNEPVVRHQLMVDELVGIAPVGLLGANGESVSRVEFARHSLLLGPKGSGTRIVAEQHLTRAEYRPARIWAFDSCEAIKRAVSAGLGISFMSRLLVDDELARGALELFRLPGVQPMLRPIHALQPSLAELTPHAAVFTTLLTEAHTPPAAAEPNR
jgi:DNA-binding transcriptional LysR family regulator